MKESYRKLSINLCHSIKDFEEGLTCLRKFADLYILQEAEEMMNCKSVQRKVFCTYIGNQGVDCPLWTRCESNWDSDEVEDRNRISTVLPVEGYKKELGHFSI